MLTGGFLQFSFLLAVTDGAALVCSVNLLSTLNLVK